jgi:hypothetical protein
MDESRALQVVIINVSISTDHFSGVALKPVSLRLLSATILIVAGLASCGSDSSSGPAPIPTSEIAKRVYVSSAFSGRTFIIDGATDTPSSFSINTAGRPAIMRTVQPQNFTVIYEDFNQAVYFVDNAQESIVAQLNMNGIVEDLAIQSDARFFYASRGALGRVDKVDIVNRTSPERIPADTNQNIPQAQRLALAPNNSKLLVFTDPATNANNDVYVVNPADRTFVTIGGAPYGFDRPYTAVFSADSTRAYVLSCGAECGGTQAKITVLDMAPTTPAVLGSVNVEGATVGLLNGSTLFVAGNRADPGNVLVPRINVVNVSNANAPTATQVSATVQGGLHTLMALGANNKLFIGGRNCSGSCLTIFDTAAMSTNPGATVGNVTSILPISGRNVVYVIENGDLKIYDTANPAAAPRTINITGALSVMNQVDP